MLMQALPMFATEEAVFKSNLVKATYETAMQDFCTDTYAANFIRGVFPVAVNERQPAVRTVRSLASLDGFLRQRLTFLHAVRCHAPC